MIPIKGFRPVDISIDICTVKLTDGRLLQDRICFLVDLHDDIEVFRQTRWEDDRVFSHACYLIAIAQIIQSEADKMRLRNCSSVYTPEPVQNRYIPVFFYEKHPEEMSITSFVKLIPEIHIRAELIGEHCFKRMMDPISLGRRGTGREHFGRKL